MAVKDKQPSEWIAGTDVWASFFDGKTKDPADIVGRDNLRLHEIVVFDIFQQDYQKHADKYQGWNSLPKVGARPLHEVMKLLESRRSKFQCGLDVFWILDSCYRLGMGYITHDQRAAQSAKTLGVPVMVPEAKA